MRMAFEGVIMLMIAAFCVTGSLQDTPFTTCKKGGPSPEALRVKGCDKSPCKFIRGQEVEAEWDFTVVADAEALKPVVKAKALGVTVPYPLPEQDACKSLTNGECPLDEGELVSYGLKMPILQSYPKVSVHLIFSLLDNNDNIHVCFEIDAKVVDV